MVFFGFIKQMLEIFVGFKIELNKSIDLSVQY